MPALVSSAAESFVLFDRAVPIRTGWPFVMEHFDFVDDGFELAGFGPVNTVGTVIASQLRLAGISTTSSL